jgi:prepilin-type N-terminal cleavage/methylation domain-containing protein
MRVFHLIYRRKQFNYLTIKQFNNGFTLVELLVVIGVMGAVTGTALLFLTNILKGSNQARITAEVKQNGQTVLDSIDRQIRNAQEIRIIDPLPSGSSSAIELVSAGGNLSLACFNPVAGPPSENGWIGIAEHYFGPLDEVFSHRLDRRVEFFVKGAEHFEDVGDGGFVLSDNKRINIGIEKSFPCDCSRPTRCRSNLSALGP